MVLRNDIVYCNAVRPMFVFLCPGKTLSDIEKSWVLLERAEHDREGALQKALLRLENLEQLAQKFGRKVKKNIFFFLFLNV